MGTDDPLAGYPVMMTVHHVAEVLHVAPKTLYGWRRAGKGPPWMPLEDQPGSAIRYPREDLRAYLAARRVGASA